MLLFYPNYFLQAEFWVDFWQTTNPSEHQYFTFEEELEGFKISCFVYQYSWHLEQKFRYIPRFPGLNFDPQIEPDLLKKLSLKLLQKIVLDCQQNDICFLKLDFEDQLASILDIQTESELKDFCQKNKQNLKVKTTTKKLQWNQTITLNLEPLLIQKEKIISAIQDEQVSTEKLADFFKTSKDFWQTTNQNVRRYTKKVLDSNWQISIAKNEVNFEAFWQVYNLTKDRQQFHIYSREYFSKLFNKDQSRIVVLRNENQVIACWFGLVSDNTLTYLYGGNTPFSLENYGQYLLHLVAVNIAFDEDLQFYDLGGFDPAHGYAKFKENYKGNKRIFAGPIDIIFKTWTAAAIELLAKLRNIF